MSTLPAMTDVLSRPPFRELTIRERQQLMALMEPHEHHPGEVILQEGDHGRALHIITRGHCTVEKHNGSLTGCRLAVLSPGMIFGEMSFLSDAPHSATVIATDWVLDWTLSRDLFDHFVQHHHNAGLAILGGLSEILAERMRSLETEFSLAQQAHHQETPRHELEDCRSQLFQNWNF